MVADDTLEELVEVYNNLAKQLEELSEDIANERNLSNGRLLDKAASVERLITQCVLRSLLLHEKHGRTADELEMATKYESLETEFKKLSKRYRKKLASRMTCK
jgi:hypothetical protein